jgi:hypothetical protein
MQVCAGPDQGDRRTKTGDTVKELPPQQQYTFASKTGQVHAIAAISILASQPETATGASGLSRQSCSPRFRSSGVARNRAPILSKQNGATEEATVETGDVANGCLDRRPLWVSDGADPLSALKGGEAPIVPFVIHDKDIFVQSLFYYYEIGVRSTRGPDATRHHVPLEQSVNVITCDAGRGNDSLEQRAENVSYRLIQDNAFCRRRKFHVKGDLGDTKIYNLVGP